MRGMQTDAGRQRLADQVRKARIANGFPKRAPYARQIGIDDSTLAIIEGARPGTVSDEMVEFVTRTFGWPAGTWRSIMAGNATGITRDETETTADFAATQMDPHLAAFSDWALLKEIRNRMLYMAGRLGRDAFEFHIDADGDTELISHTARLAQQDDRTDPLGDDSSAVHPAGPDPHGQRPASQPVPDPERIDRDPE